MKTDNCTSSLYPFSERPISMPVRWGGAASKFFVASVLKILDGLVTWQERARQRHALQSIDNRGLKDIGLSRADVDRECRKPFWMA
jgi:uncharacterized protein YjiS (DUF1127 family)